MMCLFTIFWVLALTLSFIVHLVRTNRYQKRINKIIVKRYEQEIKKIKSEKGFTEKESSDAG